MLDILILNNPILLQVQTFLDGGLADGLKTWVGGIGGALIAAALIYSLVKDAFGYAKGSGQVSIGKMVGKIVLLVVMIGFVALAASGNLDKVGQSIANFFIGLFNKGAGEIDGELGDVTTIGGAE